LLYAFVGAVPFEERQNDFGEDGAQARPPEKDVGAGLDGAAVSSQQQRGSTHEINELLLAGDLVLQHKGAHHRGQLFFLEATVVHLQIDMGHPIAAPATENAQPGATVNGANLVFEIYLESVTSIRTRGGRGRVPSR
jgi:hypothetical protein